MTLFNESLALQLLESQVEFPVDFDAAWQWLGYSRKDSAKQSLLSCDFSVGTDLQIGLEPTTTGIQAKPKETICLTVECFKDWAMMSNTEQGKQVRRYFRECEKVLKEKIKLEQSLTQNQLSIQLTNFIEEQRKSTKLLMERTNKLDAIETAHNHNIGIKGVITDEIENSYPDDASTTAADYLISKKIDLCYAGKLSRRAAQFKRCSTSTEILTKNNKNQTLYVGNQIAYLDEALKTILDI